MYDEALHWSNWSWKTTIDRAATSPVYAGSRSMAVTFTGAWAGLSLYTPSLQTAPFQRLEFAIHAGGGAPPELAASLTDSSGAVIRTVRIAPYATARSGGWYLVAIPLSDLGATNRTITRVTLQENAGRIPPRFHVDEMRFAG